MSYRRFHGGDHVAGRQAVRTCNGLCGERTAAESVGTISSIDERFQRTTAVQLSFGSSIAVIVRQLQAGVFRWRDRGGALRDA